MNSDSFQESLNSIARTVHEAVQAWSTAHGQSDIPNWDDAPEWMRASTYESVVRVIENAGMSGRELHQFWVEEKMRDGWQYGPTKSSEARAHPLMIPFDELPVTERLKDDLVVAIVRALTRQEGDILEPVFRPETIND